MVFSSAANAGNEGRLADNKNPIRLKLIIRADRNIIKTTPDKTRATKTLLAMVATLLAIVLQSPKLQRKKQLNLPPCLIESAASVAGNR